MFNSPNTANDRRQIINAIFIPFILGVLMVMSFLLEKGMDWDFHTAGIFPRRLTSLSGVLTFVFVHADWSHLAKNVFSFVLLGSFLFLFYNQIATKVLFISYLFSGLLLWFIGRECWHVGASGLIYSIAFFLFFSGIVRKHIPLIALSLVVAFICGNIIWHVFPWQIHDPISWEGHLAGGITGFILSIYYKDKGPQRPVTLWAEEEDDDSEDYTLEAMEEEDQSNRNNYTQITEIN